MLALGGWDPLPEVLLVLREALGAEDVVGRSAAAVSLGHLEDPDPTTWEHVVHLAGDREADALFTATAIVLLERLKPSGRRSPAIASLDRVAELQPGWTRDVEAFKDQLL